MTILQSTEVTTCQLTCPECGHLSVETMPTDACIYFYDCTACGVLLRPKAGGLLRLLLLWVGGLSARPGGPFVLLSCNDANVTGRGSRTSMTQSDQNPTIAERLRSALLARDFSGLESVLADDVRFGSCVGPAQVIDHLGRALGHSVAVEVVESETYEDRLILSLAFSAPESEQLPFGQHCAFAVVFVHDDQIIELKLTEDRDQATAATLSPPPPPRPHTPTTLNRLAAVLPVRDLSLALDHYSRLGFSVRSYHGGGYGYAERDGLNLHLSVVANLDPTITTSAIYIYVDDADLLYAEWRSSGVSGQFFEPHDTDYGLREGAHIDRDGNLIRFGSPLKKQ